MLAELAESGVQNYSNSVKAWLSKSNYIIPFLMAVANNL
jgi:hypothetical protein